MTNSLSPTFRCHFPTLQLLLLPQLIFQLRRTLRASSFSSSPQQQPLFLPKMEADSGTVLVLCGKSIEENELAKALKTNKSLKLPDSDDVLTFVHSELPRSSFDEEAFRVDAYMDALSTSSFGRFLIYSPKLGSTHDVVSSNFCELPIGVVCVADVQTKGRGRSKNVWESPKGCLLFSFSLQMVDGRVVPFVQYVVSLAMVEAINDLCQQNGMHHLDVKIKWPNDLYFDGLKVGSILCTSTYKSKKFNVSADALLICVV